MKISFYFGKILDFITYFYLYFGYSNFIFEEFILKLINPSNFDFSHLCRSSETSLNCNNCLFKIKKILFIFHLKYKFDYVSLAEMHEVFNSVAVSFSFFLLDFRAFKVSKVQGVKFSLDCL